MAIVYIGLGSNLHNPIKQILSGLHAISSLSGIHLLATSSLYQSSPIGYYDQANFINAVIKIETTLLPELLMDCLLSIEIQQGRIRNHNKNGPRTLDVDILMYDNLILNSDKLTLPHPRMLERKFVLIPLLEIEPTFPINKNIVLEGNIQLHTKLNIHEKNEIFSLINKKQDHN